MAFVKKVSGRDGENLSIGAHRINRNKKSHDRSDHDFFCLYGLLHDCAADDCAHQADDRQNGKQQLMVEFPISLLLCRRDIDSVFFAVVEQLHGASVALGNRIIGQLV